MEKMYLSNGKILFTKPRILNYYRFLKGNGITLKK
jgi:hypothetical protein